MTTFDPYHQWLGIPSHEQPAHHYRLLGISLFEDNADVIEMAADRQMRFLAQIVNGPNVKESQRLLNELSAARICLLNPDKKAKYDAWLKDKLATENPVAAVEKSLPTAAPEIKKKPLAPAGSLRKQAEKLLAEHEYGRAQEVLRQMMAATGPADQEDATWAKQQIAKAKSGDENMRRQSESAIQYSRKLIDTCEYADAIQLLEQFPPKFRTAKLTSNLEEATRLQQEVDLLQVDISSFMAQRNFVELKVAVQRFRELKPGNAKMKQLWADLNTYGNKPIVFLEPDQRKAYVLSTAGGITTGQMIGGAAIVVLLFGAILYATYYYIENSKKGIEKTVAQAEESTWKVEVQIDNPAANVTIDGQPVKLTGNRTSIFLLPGRHEWTAALSAGETKSGRFEVRKMEIQSVVITTGQPAAASSELLNMPWNTAEFHAWVKDVSMMTAEQQVVAVTKRLIERNPGFDGKVFGADDTGPPEIQDGVVRKLGFVTDHVADISPVRALTGLEVLICNGSKWDSGKLIDLSPLKGLMLHVLDCRGSPQLMDLSPLSGMGLTRFNCFDTSVADLSPLKGMPIQDLGIGGTKVFDLAPLRGMPLRSLYLRHTKVADLSSLVGMPLERLGCDQTEVTDLTLLKEMKLTLLMMTPSNVSKGLADIRQMRSLTTIATGWEERQHWPAAEFWRKYDAGEFGEPNLTPPPLEPWMKDIAALPVEQQVDSVAKKLVELNPGFDGKVTHQIENGSVTKLEFISNEIKNITPVRALTGLHTLEMLGDSAGLRRGQLSDLTPLTGMKLRSLRISWNLVTDLSPLKGMPLQILHCGGTKVADLSPLKGSPLVAATIGFTPVSDLSPLAETKLEYLMVDYTEATDLTPLSGLPLTTFKFTPKKILYGIDGIRQIAGLKQIGIKPQNIWPADEFWKKYDAGEFTRPGSPDGDPTTNVHDPAFQKWAKQVGALPAKTQLEEVAKKLRELNPVFDGTLNPKVENGVVTELEIITDNVWDISPVRALPKLTSLSATGTAKDFVSHGILDDLTPLRGMKLRAFACGRNLVSDLSALNGMPLTSLKIELTRVADLSPLQGMKLNVLICHHTQIADLSPLKGMPLKELTMNETKVSELTALRKMKLTSLDCGGTLVSDLSPLKGMALESLGIRDTKVDDLTPLAGMPLVSLGCNQNEVTDLTPLKDAKIYWLVITPAKITKGMDVIRQMSSVIQIAISWRTEDHFPAGDFWKKYDAGDFQK